MTDSILYVLADTSTTSATQGTLCNDLSMEPKDSGLEDDGSEVALRPGARIRLAFLNVAKVSYLSTLGTTLSEPNVTFCCM